MSKPPITVLIPTYRRPTMLRRAIRSVLNQTFADFRLCIYDNASGDATSAVIAEFQRKDSRVEYFCRPSNVGAHHNFVDAANRVETPFFSFLPDDDLIMPHFLEVAIAGLRRHPGAAMSVLATLHMSPNRFIRDAWVLQWPEGLLAPPDGMLCALRYGNPGLHGLLIRRDVWEEFGGFDKSTSPGEDFDFELRVGALRPIVVSRQPGAIQVVHSNSQSAGADLTWVWPGIPRIIGKVRAMDLPASSKSEALERLTWLLNRGLVVRGGLRSVAAAKWTDAERAAELLERECGMPKAAQKIRSVTAVCRHIPGARMLIGLLFKLRIWQKAFRGLSLQWRFRQHASLLRVDAGEPSPGLVRQKPSYMGG